MLVMAGMVWGGCSRKLYVPVESVRVSADTVRLTEVRVDSVWQHDSVAVFVKGDTVRITKYRDRFRYRDRTDTVYTARHDTVMQTHQVPVEVEKRVEVEKKLSLWKRIVLTAGYVALGLLGLLGIGWGFKRWAQSKVPKI